MKVVVLGSGGREHAICWRLAQSALVKEVVCVPGNGGTACEKKCRNVMASTAEEMVEVAIAEKCAFVVVGPEEPLVYGIADKLWAAGVPVIGPKRQGAQLEASKDVAKAFMEKYNVACAKSVTVTKAEEAHEYIEKFGVPIVIKADGLAAGKGVVVAKEIKDAHDAIDSFMKDGLLGDAGKKVVIEEYLRGVEISVLAAVSVSPTSAENGKATIVPFLPARDHKRLNDGAQGPNTGGMGAVSPLDDISEKTMAEFDERILKPTLKGMVTEKYDYRGFIFFGVMLTDDGPKLLEYNVRLGDPETQAVLPLMDFDFAAMCRSILEEDLDSFTFAWKDGYVCAPVAVSGGYPGNYEKGLEISVDDVAFSATGAKLFVAGGTLKNEKLVTSGGRVLSCAAFGKTFDEAHKASYDAMKAVSFDGMFYRKDIGLPGAAQSN
ncbi:MAG: phosphoribosylamine--glycine ligase [Treponema sp.]|nr:phosphoribosylamine--glycine ligase [Treponema sp.]